MEEILIPASREQEMERIGRPQVWCYRKVPIYIKIVGGNYTVFKKSGVTLEEMGITASTLPPHLYVVAEERRQAVQEVQDRLNGYLEEAIENGDLKAVKAMMAQVVGETFSQPRAGNLERLAGTVEIVLTGFAGDHGALTRMALIASKDYSTLLHSVNVAALVMAFCLAHKLDDETSRLLGLAGLVHDVGKLFVDDAILKAQRKLSEEEFAQMRRHPQMGYDLLVDCDLHQDVGLAALEHHEKLDGSGYPRGITDVSWAGRLVGLVDCYEALTSDERVYRKPMDPYATLQLIKGDVASGKLDRQVFKEFSLTLL